MSQNSIKQKLKNFVHLVQAYNASRKYSFPAKKLKIIGVTGTDGKTTVSTMLYHVLKTSGHKVGYISTINAKIGDEELDTGLHVTTPDPWDVPRYLSMMVEKGIEYVVLESTSMGLEQNRLFGVEFDSSIITNIKNDHLDYHETWENYADSKIKIMRMTKKGGKVVLNKDDKKSFEYIISKKIKGREIVAVGMDDISNTKHDVEGIKYTYQGHEFSLSIVGRHNFLNSLQVIELCKRYIPLETIKYSISTFKTPEGRMQIMQRHPFSVIVDFAHTPIALESALDSLNDIKTEKSRVITVFGCAGKRDKGRRLMGEVSSRLADITVLTAEDSRDEKLFDINTEIAGHAEANNGRIIKRFPNTEAFEDTNLEMIKERISSEIKNNFHPIFAFDKDDVSCRVDAIKFAISIAEEGDIVFITGKGHERSLAFGKDEQEFDWSDQEIVRENLS